MVHNRAARASGGAFGKIARRGGYQSYQIVYRAIRDFARVRKRLRDTRDHDYWENCETAAHEYIA